MNRLAKVVTTIFVFFMFLGLCALDSEGVAFIGSLALSLVGFVGLACMGWFYWLDRLY